VGTQLKNIKKEVILSEKKKKQGINETAVQKMRSSIPYKRQD
jgi:hypothetical protein